MYYVKKKLIIEFQSIYYKEVNMDNMMNIVMNTPMKTFFVGGYFLSTMYFVSKADIAFDDKNISNLEKTLYVIGAPLLVPSLITGAVCGLSIRWFYEKIIK